MQNIAIIGTTEHKADAPYDDPAWDIWGLSTNLELPRITRWYELHNLDRKFEKEPDYIRRLQQALTDGECEVWVARQHKLMPGAKVFPKDAAIERFGEYWTNTVAWQLAHAIIEWEEAGKPADFAIGLWGIDMATNSEYADQRPSVEYMIGVAKGLGIEVVISEKSDLLKSRGLYGFDDAHNAMAVKIHQRDNILAERLKMAEDAHKNAMTATQALQGALTELYRWRDSGSLNGHGDMIEARIAEVESHLEQSHAIARNAEWHKATVLGAIENQKWVKQGL